MPLPLIAAAATGGQLLGTILTNNANKQMNEDNNTANANLAEDNRLWQTWLSNTAHQREAVDLKEAGLNRILTATGGGGASTPSSPVATMNASHMEDTLGKGVSSALQSAQLDKELSMAESQKALNASSIQTQQSLQDLQTANATKVHQDALKVARENNIAEPALAKMRDAAAYQASADLKTAKMNDKMATYDAIQTRTKNTLDTIGSAKDAINPFKGLLGPGKNIPPAGEIFKNRSGESGYYDKSGKFYKSN